MRQLPKWCITDKFPALYDTESATVIEMTAKVYNAMSELVNEYNDFVNNMLENINKFESDTNTDIEHFTVSLRQEFQDFIDVIETKASLQDTEIQKAYEYLVSNLKQTVTNTVVEEINKGTLQVGLTYIEGSESLNMVATPTVIEPTRVQYDETNEEVTII